MRLQGCLCKYVKSCWKGVNILIVWVTRLSIDGYEAAAVGKAFEFDLQFFAKSGRMTAKEATEAAARLGFTKRIPVQKAPFDTHGQALFQRGNRFISPDADVHSGGAWKMFDINGRRLGTYDANLKRIGD